MIAFKDFYIKLMPIDFICPHCVKLHKDENDKYFNRIIKSKTWNVKINCDCGKPFYLTVNYQGKFQTFKK